MLGGHVGQCGHLRGSGPAGLRRAPPRSRRPASSISASCSAQRFGFQISRWSATPTTTHGPSSPACSIRCFGIRTRPAESSVSSEPGVEAPLHHPPLAAERVELGERSAARVVVTLRRVDLDAGVEARRENHSIGQRRPEAGRDREPVLGVEAVLVLTAKRQRGPLRSGSSRRKFGPEWRGGRSLTTPVPGSTRLRHANPLCPTLQHNVAGIGTDPSDGIATRHQGRAFYRSALRIPARASAGSPDPAGPVSCNRPCRYAGGVSDQHVTASDAAVRPTPTTRAAFTSGA